MPINKNINRPKDEGEKGASLLFVLIVLHEIKTNAFKHSLLFLESSVASVHLLGGLIIACSSKETISS